MGFVHLLEVGIGTGDSEAVSGIFEVSLRGTRLLSIPLSVLALVQFAAEGMTRLSAPCGVPLSCSLFNSIRTTLGLVYYSTKRTSYSMVMTFAALFQRASV